MPQAAAGKYHILIVVVNGLGGHIAIRCYLIEHHLALLVELAVGEKAIGNQVAYQLHRPGVVAAREDGIYEGVLLGGVGIEFAAHALHPVDDMVRAAALRTFKYSVLHEVGNARERAVVAAAGTHRHAEVAHRASRGQMHYPQAIG